MADLDVPAFDPAFVAGMTPGTLDGFDYVDGLPRLVPHPRPTRVPLGAPLLIRGWALDPIGAAPAAVRIVLDSVRTLAAETGRNRADVAQPGGPQAIGYRTIVPTDGLLPGGHELRAYALSSEGGWYQCGHQAFVLYGASRLEFAPSERRCQLRLDQIVRMTGDGAIAGFDVPVPRGEFVLITGWALDPVTAAAPAGVVALHEGGAAWQAPCDTRRADIQAAHQTSSDRLGFAILVAADDLPAGRHHLSLQPYDVDGRRYASAVTATVDIAAPLRAFPTFARPAGDVAARAVVRGAWSDASGPPAAGRHPGPVHAGNDPADGPAVACAAGRTITARRGSPLIVDGWIGGTHEPSVAVVFFELSAVGMQLPPQRFPAISGFRASGAPRELPAPAAGATSFQARFEAPAVRRAFSLAALALDTRTGRYVRAPLGTLEIAAD